MTTEADAMTVAAAQLRSYVERVERLDADIKDLNADKSELYQQAKGDGFDVKALRAVVAKRKLDDAKREEADMIFDLYWSALHGVPSRVHVHEARAREEQVSSQAGTVTPSQSQTKPAESLGDTISATQSTVGVDAPETAGKATDDAVTAGETATPFMASRPLPALRPNCLDRANCGSYGFKHCRRCAAAAGEVEAA
ncbi:MAG: hypothetical protein DI629_12285 [Mesorhizobium amorphae]|nr:MAG: hypothetical protein DI629_12285 [Mesorhizobium amorphae]